MKNNNLNVVFAVLFLFGFIFLWQSFVMSRYGTPDKKVTVAAQAQAEKAADNVIRDVQSAPAAVAGTRTGDADAIVSLTAENNEVVFLARGARVGSWHLKEKDHWLEMLLPEKLRTTSPLEMFPDLVYASQKKTASQAVFTAKHPAGFEITKTISLLAKPPFHTVSVDIKNPTDRELMIDTALAWGSGLDKHEVGAPYDEKSSVVSENGAVALGEHRMTWSPGMVFGRSVDRTDTGSFKWVGVTNHHFFAAIVAPEGSLISTIRVALSRELPPQAGAVISGRIAPGETLHRDYLLFVGPKQPALLKEAGHGLEEAIDYGTFGIISKGLLTVLNFYHGLTGNYGWAIVLLTFSLQILLLPLTRKSLQHTLKMKELQPHLKKLQEQHKADPKRYQMEMMNFYKKNGMKFMGLEGCIPLLLQMPIFLAFYTTLNNAYDLRGAPWIFWVTDLAIKDPYYVLPILMGLGMFVQQKLSGAAIDPAQARMMMIMPLVFTFMFMSMPAGLVLYWVVNSAVTIAIQKFLSWRSQSNPPAIVA